VTKAPTKAVIAAAGVGARQLPATKEQPKEMLPVFSRNSTGGYSLKPVVQMIFEQLHDCGFREFCFIVGRGKRAIEDHFTPDPSFERLLRSGGHPSQAEELHVFYQKVRDSTVHWVNQPEPRGFGHAVSLASAFVQAGRFLVHAGDNHVISDRGAHIRRLVRLSGEDGVLASLLLRRVKDPRSYGVAEVARVGRELWVEGVEEKPRKPKSNLALLPAYVFGQDIFDALRNTPPDKSGEVQLTDGIGRMIEQGMAVRAVRVIPGEFWLDVGTPETYWDALRESHDWCLGHQ
jgi:UTP--glucose-1-phosphate uridylyltransferase